MRHPSALRSLIVLDEHDTAAYAHTPDESRQYVLSIRDEMQRVREEHSVEQRVRRARKIEGPRKVGFYRDDVWRFPLGPIADGADARGIDVHRVDGATAFQNSRERAREGAGPGADVGPTPTAVTNRCSNQCDDVTRLHARKLTTASASAPWRRSQKP